MRKKCSRINCLLFLSSSSGIYFIQLAFRYSTQWRVKLPFEFSPVKTIHFHPYFFAVNRIMNHSSVDLPTLSYPLITLKWARLNRKLESMLGDPVLSPI